MNDLVPEDNYVPREVLVKDGMTAIGSLAGSVVLLIVKALPAVVGIVAGGIITVVGLGALFSSDKTDKKAGIAITVAGALSLLARFPFLGKFAGGLLTLGIIGLLGVGIWKGVKFLRGLKARG